MEFNREQQQAMEHKDGPMLVLAGPGSGKTEVIIRRTRKLIQNYQVAPSSILVVTFTKAAAGQMRERFLHLCGVKKSQVTFGTFHGIFYGILRQAYGITSANIAGEEIKYQILRQILQNSSLQMEDENDLLESLAREISTVKNGRIPLSHYYSASCPDEQFRKIYETYEKRLHGKRLLDFDDLLVYCYQLFQKHPDILQAWQKKFRYILIDEFQDVNQLQYDIVRLLALPENNLFLVGDDDQSIYRFRGARPEIMLQIPKDFPQLKQVILKQNYRCTGEIVEKSQNVIRWNDARYEKQLFTKNDKGKPLEIRTFENESEETTWLLKQIQKDLAEGCPHKEIAILFRTNHNCRMTVERLMEYNIPFTMRDVLPNLYEHWLAKNMVAYMRLAMLDLTDRLIKEGDVAKEAAANPSAFPLLPQRVRSEAFAADRYAKARDILMLKESKLPEFVALSNYEFYRRTADAYYHLWRATGNAADRRKADATISAAIDRFSQHMVYFQTLTFWQPMSPGNRLIYNDGGFLSLLASYANGNPDAARRKIADVERRGVDIWAALERNLNIVRGKEPPSVGKSRVWDYTYEAARTLSAYNPHKYASVLKKNESFAIAVEKANDFHNRNQRLAREQLLRAEH